MLIVLEGIDGAGKSTIARLLHQRLESRVPAVRHYHKLSAEFDHPYLDAHMRTLRGLLELPADEHHYLSLFGERHWLFLLAAWFSVVQKHRIERATAPDRLTLVDGWYYRFIAKFLYKGTFERDWLFSLFGAVDEPDLVVLLDVDPRIAWTRRPRFKPSEIGLYEVKDTQLVGDDFQLYCAYQSALRQTLLQFAVERSWFVVHQTAGTTRDDTCDRIVAHLLAAFPELDLAGEGLVR